MDPRHGRPRQAHSAPAGAPLVGLLAKQLLGHLDRRWRHKQGVARRAEEIADVVAPADRPLLVAAACLHDIGYAEPLRRSAFHPLDGAWHPQETSWGRTVAGLVAHHSGSRFVAAVRGLDVDMGAFDEGRCVKHYRAPHTVPEPEEYPRSRTCCRPRGLGGIADPVLEWGSPTRGTPAPRSPARGDPRRRCRNAEAGTA